MSKSTKKSSKRTFLGLAITGLLLSGLGATALAGGKDVPDETASFAAYSEVKDYAEKYVCDKPTDETANQCQIAKNATDMFYQTDYCKELDEDGACVLASYTPDAVEKALSCSTESHRQCQRMPDGGRSCWMVTCTTCCRPTFPFASCTTICGPVLR